PDEIKGIIGSCDMFIGCRMHAVIASLSMYVPTLAIGYGTKFMGVVGQMLNQEEWLIQIEHFSFEEILALLKAKIDCLWEKRIIVRNNLSKTVLSVKALALSNCDVIKNFLENKQKK
ncbi:MAG: polysaccharide pyruvyl transferase family protein, partial [Candidatus Bathyarchaeia archaeon]